jgi:hypothetical protein
MFNPIHYTIAHQSASRQMVREMSHLPVFAAMQGSHTALPCRAPTQHRHVHLSSVAERAELLKGVAQVALQAWEHLLLAAFPDVPAQAWHLGEEEAALFQDIVMPVLKEVTRQSREARKSPSRFNSSILNKVCNPTVLVRLHESVR